MISTPRILSVIVLLFALGMAGAFILVLSGCATIQAWQRVDK